jgi:hypothetical protein
MAILNNEFSKLNARTDGPKFSFDLLKCSRVRTGRNKRKLKSKYTFNMKDLYNDGIHPNPLLAHLWLRVLTSFRYIFIEWGDNFRQEYQQLSELRSFFQTPVMALTGTSTKKVKADITTHLRPEFS